MFCLKCGKELNEGAVFCPKCGTKVETSVKASLNPEPADTAIIEEVSEETSKEKTDNNTSNTVSSGEKTDKNGQKTGLIIGAVAVIAVIIGAVIYNSQNNAYKSGTYSTTAESYSSDYFTNNLNSTNESGTGSVQDGASQGTETVPENCAADTIMIYMIGSNLESGGEDGIKYGRAATDDLIEMAQAKWGDDVNVIVEAGGSKEWALKDISSSALHRLEIKDENIYPVQELPLEQMSTSSALADFISWGAANYPAKRYGLILWDHGGGLLGGFGNDELFDMNSMYIPNITSAIKESGIHFDFVGYDACLMASFEAAYALKDCADYLIASEELESGIGWYYTEWLNKLGSDPNLSMEELGRSIVNGMVGGNQEIEHNSTLSLIDLSKMPDVYDAWLLYMKDLGNELKKGNFPKQSSARQNCRNYGANKEKGTYTDMIDMLDFVDETKLPNSFDLENKIRSCIVYSNTDIPGSNGLSVYAPFYYTDLLDSIAIPQLQAIGFDETYFEYFNSFCSYLAAGNSDIDYTPTEQIDPSQVTEITIPDFLRFEDIGDGQPGIPLTWDQHEEIADIYVETGLIQYNEIVDGQEDTRVWTKGQGIDRPLIKSDGTIIADTRMIDAMIYSEQDIVNGEAVDFIPMYSYIVDQSYDDDITYQTRFFPAYLNGDEQINVVTASVYRSIDDYTIDVLGYLPENSDDLGDKGLRQFSVGDRVEFLTAYYRLGIGEDPNTKHIDRYEGFSVFLTKTVGEKGLFAKYSETPAKYRGEKSDYLPSYVYRFIIKDIYNKMHYTEWLYW